MFDVIAIVVFHLAVFGGCYAAGGAIADLLHRVGIWRERDTGNMQVANAVRGVERGPVIPEYP